jgi:hypothetical protein
VIDLTAPARWAYGLGRELSQLPSTLRKARRALVELPDRLDSLVSTLERTADELHRTTEALTDTLPGIPPGLEAIDAHVVKMHASVESLDQTLRAAVGSVPGVRRALRREPTAP